MSRERGMFLVQRERERGEKERTECVFGEEKWRVKIKKKKKRRKRSST